jgi:hypothetical protein
METYTDQTHGSDGWYLIAGFALIISTAMVFPPYYAYRTSGASASAFHARDGKPILMELKNCRVVSAESGR